MPRACKAASVGLAMRHGDRVQARRIGREIGRPQGPLPVAARAGQPRQRLAVALDRHVLDPAVRKDVDVLRQRECGGPGLGRIDRAAGPIDADPALGQPGELLDQEQRPPRAGIRRVQHVAGKHHEVGVFGQHGLEQLAAAV